MHSGLHFIVNDTRMIKSGEPKLMEQETVDTGRAQDGFGEET